MPFSFLNFFSNDFLFGRFDVISIIMVSLKLYFIFVLQEEEMFRPNMFFLLLLPPIIFESGYSLHKVSPCQTLILHVEVLFGTHSAFSYLH